MFDKNAVLARVRAQSVVSYSVALLVEQYINHDYTQSSLWTVRTRASHLKCLVEFCRAAQISYINELTMPILDTFYSIAGETRKPSTIMAMKRTTRAFSQWLIDDKELYPPFLPQAIRIKKINNNDVKAINIDQVRRVIKESDFEDSLIIELILETGLRIAELCRVRTCDITGLKLHVFGKGNKEDDVYITEELKARIDCFTEQRERHGESYLFQKNNGWFGQLTTQNARSRIQKCFLKHAGIKMTPHQLRHTFAIEMIKSGCNPISVQRMLRHENFATTQIYLRLTDTYIEEEHTKYMKVIKNMPM